MFNPCKLCGKPVSWERSGLRFYCCEDHRLTSKREQNRIAFHGFYERKRAKRRLVDSAYVDILIKAAYVDQDSTKRLVKFLEKMAREANFENV
jgi:hypothetical protein